MYKETKKVWVQNARGIRYIKSSSCTIDASIDNTVFKMRVSSLKLSFIILVLFLFRAHEG